MILRKPYAFFIKMFKPIHIIVAISIAYLIYLNSKILGFLNDYIYSSSNAVGQNIRDGLVSNFLFIIPAAIILFSLIILGVMFRKKKPVTFYIINIFAYIVVIVINLYASNFLGVLEKSIVAVKAVKLIHDLVLINVFVESITFIFFVVRGMGVNFRKFNFDSEISKFDINDSDKEEFELDINVDLSESKRKRKQKIRFLKYKYLENKFIVNIFAVVFIILVGIITYLTIYHYTSKNTEGNNYSVNGFNIRVDETIILNTDYNDQKITDDYLIIVNCNMNSSFSNKKIYLNDFSLRIGEAIFKPTIKYNEYLLDIGNVYDEVISSDYKNYLFVYEIPEKYITSDMVFSYVSEGERLDISLKPKDLVSSKISISKGLNEELSFKDSLGDIKFTIIDYEIADRFVFDYNYCIKKDDCIPSKEYMKPSIDKNFDKVVLRLNVNYKDNSNLKLNSFYKFFSRFGSISYKKNDTWYTQKGNFEELKSSKASVNNNIYIGIKSDIMDADEIKFVFNIRDSKYEYLLK